jgi:hypothetical protein
MTDGLRAITIAAGVPEKLDLTLTAAWWAKVQAAIERAPDANDFDTFAGTAPELFRAPDR